MTLIALTDCCRLLAIDPKTVRRWLQAAQLSLSAHPTDGRSKGLPSEQLEQLALAHRRTLVGLSAQPHACPPTSKPELATTLPESELLSGLLAHLSTVQEQLSRLSYQLEQVLPPASAGPAHPPALAEAAPLASPPAELAAASNQQETVEETRPSPTRSGLTPGGIWPRWALCGDLSAGGTAQL
jgi:hypothetical protein